MAPALLLAAGHDPARDDSRRYHARLTDAGVDSELVEYPGTIHAFLSFAGALDVAREALTLIVCRLRARLAHETPALHHAALPYPPTRAHEARAFYGDLLGLREQPVPVALADRPFLWFALGDGTELHLIPNTVQSARTSDTSASAPAASMRSPTACTGLATSSSTTKRSSTGPRHSCTTRSATSSS